MTSPLPLSRWNLRLAARLSLAALLAISLANAGCVSAMLADRIVRAPNQQGDPDSIKGFADFQKNLDSEYYSLMTKIHVQPDPAELSVAVLEPGDYALKHELKVTQEGTPEKPLMGINLTFSSQPRDKTKAATAPKGTIFLLHGIWMNKESMLHWGLFLAQKGYRTVLIDLRGHGRSTGDVITYGARETGDLTQVLDELTKRGMIAGRVGVLGVSYGASLAIDWAARDSRVASVVALAPFSDAREAIGEFGRAMVPDLMKHVSADALAKALAQAAKQGNFTWDETDVVAAARKLRTPILLFHGSHDTWIPISHSEKIRDAAPVGSRLSVGQGNHLTLALRLAPIAEPIASWFDRGLAQPGPAATVVEGR